MCASERPIQAALFGGVDRIESGRDFAGLVFGDVLGQRHSIQSAPRHTETLPEGLRGVKQFVGNGQCNFHTLVIPRYAHWDKRPNKTLQPHQHAEPVWCTLRPMPTVLRDGPYRMFFYSADRGEPPHVHVVREAKEAKF